MLEEDELQRAEETCIDDLDVLAGEELAGLQREGAEGIPDFINDHALAACLSSDTDLAELESFGKAYVLGGPDEAEEWHTCLALKNGDMRVVKVGDSLSIAVPRLPCCP